MTKQLNALMSSQDEVYESFTDKATFTEEIISLKDNLSNFAERIVLANSNSKLIAEMRLGQGPNEAKKMID
jgi:hypothetical protein